MFGSSKTWRRGHGIAEQVDRMPGMEIDTLAGPPSSPPAGLYGMREVALIHHWN